MILKPPFIISSRLMAAVKIADCTISIGYYGSDGNGRDVYQAWFDFDTTIRTHHNTDLKSGCGGGTLQGGMESLLSFLSAAAESRAYRERNHRKEKGENENLFPARITAWAAQHSDEIDSLHCKIEETPGLIQE